MRIALQDGWVDGTDGAVHRSAQVHLRKKELDLLRYLAERPGTTVGRAELYAAVWGYHPDSRSRTIDTTVRRVREAIEPDPANPAHLVTEPAIGYRFVPPATDRDLAHAHALDGVRGVSSTGTTVFWGPPGCGKSHWLRATGLPGADDATGDVPGLSTRGERPRTPGVRAIEVTPLSPAAARALVTRRLAELGATVAVPDDLSPWDGLPGPLLLAAERADLLAVWGPPGTNDPYSIRFAALVAGDGALGALAAVGVAPSDVVLAAVGEARVRSWVDRGLVRRGDGVLAPLAHVARVAAPDPELAARLQAAVDARFLALQDPQLGAPTEAIAAQLRALAPHVRDPALAALRAKALGSPVPEPPGVLGLLLWARQSSDPDRVLARAEGAPAAVRATLRAMALRRKGDFAGSTAEAPPDQDRSPLAGEWAFQLAQTANVTRRTADALHWYQEALSRWSGAARFEERALGGLGHTQVMVGHNDEAKQTFERLLRGDAECRAEGHLGLAYSGGLAAGDRATALTHVRAARDLLPHLSPNLAVQVACECGTVFRELDDPENARAALLLASDGARVTGLPRHLRAQLHYGFGTVLLADDEPEPSLVHFAEAAEPGGAADLAGAALVLSGMAYGFLGRWADARAAMRAGVARLGAEPTRTRMLASAWSAGVADPPDALDAIVAYADRTLDPALQRVARATRAGLAGAPDGLAEDPYTACSFEIRIARRWFATLRNAPPV